MKNISKIKLLLIVCSVLFCFRIENCMALSYDDAYSMIEKELDNNKKSRIPLGPTQLSDAEKKELAQELSKQNFNNMSSSEIKMQVSQAMSSYKALKKTHPNNAAAVAVKGQAANFRLKAGISQPSDQAAAQRKQSGQIVLQSMERDGKLNYKRVDPKDSTEKQQAAKEHNKQVEQTRQEVKEHFTDDYTKDMGAVAALDNAYREAYEDAVRSNAGYCDIEALKTDYMANCYSCVIVSTLIRTFMNISNITYPLTQEAGIKLLTIGMFLWLAFFVLQKVSSFVSLEPMKILQELFVFFFKCLLAYTLITAGLRMITDLLVDPILKAGADYGISIIDSVMSDWSTKDDNVKSEDDYYQMEKVKDQQDAAKVAQENDVKVVGQIDANKVRPENMSQISEGGHTGNYCQIGGDNDWAFGAHQLDYRYGAAEFAKQCSNPQIRNAYSSSGYQACANTAVKLKQSKGKDAYKSQMNVCGRQLRSKLKPIIQNLCSSAAGQNQMKELQETYAREYTYKKAFDLVNSKCGTKLNLSNYNQPQYFTLSAALISGYNHNQAEMSKLVKNLNCSANANAMGNQLYDGLNSWWRRQGGGSRYLDEKKMCQDVLAGKNIDTSTFASSGGSSSPTYSGPHNYYVVKDKNDSYSLIPIASDGKTVVDSTVFDKIMKISRKADQAVSLNFVIGNAIICHSMHAGAYEFSTEITETIGIHFYFPDIWLWACGALIWFFALMVVIGVNFYLLDLSFKVGFALLALPVTIGLWPFNKFKGEFVKCIKIIANAAGTFMFLGISTGLSVVLISTALGGTDALFDAIANDNKRYISEKFSLTGGSFLLILFAFLYSHKLISETVSKMADSFFSSVTNGLDPMHKKTTQAIDFAKKQVTNVVSGVGGAAGKAVNKNVINPLKNGAQNMTKKAARGVVKGISGLMGGNKK